MEPMLADFAEVVQGLDFQEPEIAVVSNLTGEVASAEELRSPRYWVDHVRRTVRFHDGLRTVHARGVDTLLELGPNGVLSALAQGAGPPGSPWPYLRCARTGTRPRASSWLWARCTPTASR